MDPALKARLTSRDLWLRLLYMILFAIAYGVAELLVTLVVVFQFVFILLTGSANEPLLRFGQNLSRYIVDILRFQTFNSEDKPFPFADWPEEAAGGDRWRDGGDGVPSEADAPADAGTGAAGAPTSQTPEPERGPDPSSAGAPPAEDAPSGDETPRQGPDAPRRE